MAASTRFWASTIALIVSCGGCSADTFELAALDAGGGITPTSRVDGPLVESGASDHKKAILMDPGDALAPAPGDASEAAARDAIATSTGDASALQDGGALQPEAEASAADGMGDASDAHAPPSLCCGVPSGMGTTIPEPCAGSSWRCYAGDPGGPSSCSRPVCAVGQSCVWMGTTGFFQGTVMQCP
jgi:hypothetical protein